MKNREKRKKSWESERKGDEPLSPLREEKEEARPTGKSGRRKGLSFQRKKQAQKEERGHGEEGGSVRGASWGGDGDRIKGKERKSDTSEKRKQECKKRGGRENALPLVGEKPRKRHKERENKSTRSERPDSVHKGGGQSAYQYQGTKMTI